MKKKLLKITIIFFIFFNAGYFVYANEKIILPEKKPDIIKNQKSNEVSNYLVPLKKPVLNTEKTEQKKVEKLIIDGEIIPLNKPLFVKKEKSVRAKKSKYYLKKDYDIAKIAVRSMEQRKWSSAEKTAKKAKDKSIYNFIQWRHLLTKGNNASFYDYKLFIDNNPNYPRIGRIKYLSEHKLSTNKISPKKKLNMISDIGFENTLKYCINKW